MGISNKTNLIIIASGKPKIWDKLPDIGPVKASEVYTGTFHRLSRAYAEQFANEYLILSPKYGFLRPDDIVLKTYDVRFTMKGTGADTIQLGELKEQWQITNKPYRTNSDVRRQKVQRVINEHYGW